MVELLNISNIPIPLKDVACQALLASPSVVHHGNLRRRRMLNNWAAKVNVKQLNEIIRWRQSYVVLLQGCLYIYDDEMSMKPTRATSLYGFTGIERCHHEVPRVVSWPFRLTSSLEEKDRSFYFSAPCEKDMKLWISHFQDQLSFANFHRQIERLSTVFVSQQPQDDKVTPPPLPPPRNKIPGAEYVFEEDDDDDDEFDYSEIKDDALETTINSTSFSQNEPKVMSKSSEDSQAKLILGKIWSSACAGISSSAASTTKSTPDKSSFPPKPALKQAYYNPQNKESRQSTIQMSGSDDSGIQIQYIGSPQYLELEKEVKTSNKDDVLQEAYWNGKAEDADVFMKAVTHNGSYMVRDSSDKGAQTLMVRIDSNIVKYKILVDEKGRLGLMVTGPYFESLVCLINFYRSNPLPKRTLSLTLPFSAVYSV